jgi:hypothetical protein
MVAEPVPTLDDLLTNASRRVFHLEMRDLYDESGWLQTWRRGEPYDWSAAFAPWIAKVRPVVARGVDFRRARVVSEPASEYIRYEHELTPFAAVAAGERVRWLSRSKADGLRLPANDFWLVDDVLLFSHFSGDGVRVGTGVGDPDSLAFCVEAFENVWRLGLDHRDYQPT